MTPGNPLFGVEQRNLGGPGFPGTGVGRCLTTAASGIVSVGTGANRVFYGAVPVVTLDLPIDYAYDEYDNQFTYAVSSTVSDSRWQGNITGTAPPRPRPDGGALGEGENPQGAITIQELDPTGALATVYNNMQFSLISHGRNRGGAYTSSGTLFESPPALPCNANNTGRDSENCDFLTAAPNNTLLDAERNRSSNSNSPLWYDDSLVYTLKGVNDKQDYWALGQIDTTDVIMLNTGGVGIGVAAPAEKVDVAGRVRAYSYLHASDSRLKENVLPLDNKKALENLKAIDIVEYDYIGRHEKHKKIGVIAQDLQKIYPELVYKGRDDYWAVDYVSMTGPIIQSLQELAEEKDSEISGLKHELSEVLKRLEAIENKE